MRQAQTAPGPFLRSDYRVVNLNDDLHVIGALLTHGECDVEIHGQLKDLAKCEGPKYLGTSSTGEDDGLIARERREPWSGRSVALQDTLCMGRECATRSRSLHARADFC